MRLSLALPFAVIAIHSAPSWAGQISYVGAHPVADHDYCYIEAPHVHAYGPSVKLRPSFRAHGGALYFVGDPVAHRYDGDSHRYHGHHPISTASFEDYGVISGDDEDLFCYIDGPHFHAFAPVASLRFERSQDTYFYAGPVPASYAAARVEFKPMTTYYARAEYVRPVAVEVPTAYVFAEVRAPAVVVEAPAAHAHVGAEAHAVAGVSAGIAVHVPVIEIHPPTVEVSGGMVVGVVGDDHHHHRHKVRKRGKKRGHWKNGKRKHRRRHMFAD